MKTLISFAVMLFVSAQLSLHAQNSRSYIRNQIEEWEAVAMLLLL